MDNTTDMIAKGRSRFIPPPITRGDDHHSIKLTTVALQQLKEMRGQGVTVVAIGKKLGVTKATVYNGLRKLHLVSVGKKLIPYDIDSVKFPHTGS